MAEHPLDTIRRMDRELFDHIAGTNELVFADGAIPKKYKLLMAMAFDAAHGASGGVCALAQQATKEGATREEVAESIRVACFLSGVGSAYTAARALSEIF